MANWNLFADKLLKIEGGYQANPNDRGNYACPPKGAWAKRSGSSYVCENGSAPVLIGTKYGVAAPNLCALRGRMVTKADMQSFTKSEATAFFKNEFWLGNRIGEISDQPLAEIFCDGCVNHGSGFGVKMMQQVLNDQFGENLAEDGGVGTLTLAAIERHNAHAIFNAYRQRRIDWYKSQIGDARNGTFVNGWLARMEKFPVFIGDLTTAPSEAKGWLRLWFMSVPASVHSAAARKDAVLLLLCVGLLVLIGWLVYREIKLKKKLSINLQSMQ